MPTNLLTNCRPRSIKLMIHIIWILVCLVTLTFPAKYRERLRLFEDLVDTNVPAWSTPPTYSDRGPKNKDDSQKTMREKQQEEWDRLNIAVSVITATSAAALAIQATSPTTHVYWLVTAFYSTAFGLSLQGLLLITYMTITAGGASDEAIGRLARGELISSRYNVVKPAAFILALPAILATYSSISLFAGLVIMVFSGPGEGVETKSREYILVTMIPVGIAFLCLCAAITLCEIGCWIEIWKRRQYKEQHQNHTSPPVLEDVTPVACCNCCSKTRNSAAISGIVSSSQN